jgi:hypothetical protein
MGRIIELRPDSAAAQTARIVPRWIVLPGNLVGREREVKILPERISHIHERRPKWLAFADAYLTRRVRKGSLWKAGRGP